MLWEFNNLTIIGTSHVSTDSIKEIRKTIDEKEPKLIAIELDKRRAYALLTNQKKADGWTIFKQLGLVAFIFYSIGEYVQRKVGDALNINPGADMKEALDIAKKKNIPFGLIDREIEITLRRLGKNLKWKDKKNFISDLLFGFLKKNPDLNFDVSKVPPSDLIRKILSLMKNRYPGLYKTLIFERDQIMSQRLVKMMKFTEGNIVAVVGAGHLDGMTKAIQKAYIE